MEGAHHRLAVLLPRNPCLSSIPRLTTAERRFSFARNRHCHNLVATERIIRGRKRRGEKRKMGKRARRKVCEHLTFLFLLWDLVLVKQFSDFPALLLFMARLTMRACVRSEPPKDESEIRSTSQYRVSFSF